MSSTKPDFSGTWRLNRERSLLQIAAPDDTIFVVEHREPALRITRTHVVGDTRDTFSLDLTTDGREVSIEREGLRLRSRAGWEGETLLFDSHVTRGADEGTNTVRYTLAADGGSFVAEERFRSKALNYDNRWVLDRVEPA